jgi:long-chain fatty acid transport protein
MLTAVQGIYIDSRFDSKLSGFGGGDGGNAGGFVPSGGLHYVHRVTTESVSPIAPKSIWNSRMQSL